MGTDYLYDNKFRINDNKFRINDNYYNKDNSTLGDSVAIKCCDSCHLLS